MKKKILGLLILTAMLFSAIGGISAFAQVSMEECDRCFQRTMNSLLERDEVEGNAIAAVRKPVYDITLEQLGYVYEFDTAESRGYAIIICDDGNYVAIEVFKNAVSPYSSVSEEEQNVFVNTMSYFKAVDGAVCDIATGTEISGEALSVLEDNAILYTNSGLATPEYVNVVVEYQDLTEDYYEMCFQIPQYCASDLTGACAAVAGGNIVGYFDRYYEDLIPNHAAGEMKGDYYYYDFGDHNVIEAINTLYADMNGSSNGITEANFKSGLQKYCSRKGLNCSFTSLKSGSSLNYDSVKSSMKANKPVALFLSTYNICDLGFGEQKDYLNYELYSGNHVMAGFGYRDIIYTLTSGGTSRYRFIYVATGFVTPSDAYFNLDYHTNIISAYGINIY